MLAGSREVGPPKQYGVDFLAWLRRVTEDAWAGLDDPPEDEFNLYWRRGTRWTGGLSEKAIAGVEGRYGVRFPPDYRLLLHTLHSTTPWMRGGGYVDGGVDGANLIEPYDMPGFYDWLRDGPSIREAMAAVASVMSRLPFDQQAWQRTWLDRDPKPALIPIFGHRYVVADETQWILSIVDEDAIVYSDNMRDYLLLELEDLLGQSTSRAQ